MDFAIPMRHEIGKSILFSLNKFLCTIVKKPNNYLPPILPPGILLLATPDYHPGLFKLAPFRDLSLASVKEDFYLVEEPAISHYSKQTLWHGR